MQFRYEFLENMPENEAIEMVYKYSRFFEVPITEQTAYLLLKQTEGSEELEKLEKQYNRLLGKFNYHKGYFAEYLILDQLKLHAGKNNDLFKSITR